MLKHTCHCPDCDREIPPRLFACKPHWSMLPAGIKIAILHNYRPGQEITKTPSSEYLKAFKTAIAFYRDKANG